MRVSLTLAKECEVDNINPQDHLNISPLPLLYCSPATQSTTSAVMFDLNSQFARIIQAAMLANTEICI